MVSTDSTSPISTSGTQLQAAILNSTDSNNQAVLLNSFKTELTLPNSSQPPVAFPLANPAYSWANPAAAGLVAAAAATFGNYANEGEIILKSVNSFNLKI